MLGPSTYSYCSEFSVCYLLYAYVSLFSFNAYVAFFVISSVMWPDGQGCSPLPMFPYRYSSFAGHKAVMWAVM